jgi:NADPH:quinone reductase-like Zn-dependent oxidoreductase
MGAGAEGMRIFISREAGGIDTLRLEDAPPPGPLGPGQIRIAMRAASVNYRDLLWMRGMFGPPGPNGLIPCSDGAGKVIETAPDVTRFKAGDRVALIFNPDWIGGKFRTSGRGSGLGSALLPGTMRDEITVHQSEAVMLPPHLSFAEGAAFPCAGVTAWHALCAAAPLMPGMTVLTQGAGGVSLFAMQFAKLFGARVIMTSSSPERCASLRQMGADAVIDYKADPDWNVAVRDLTGGMGADLVLDIGGAETVERSLNATRNGGRLALIGLLTGFPKGTAALFSAGVDITPIKVGSREDYENMNRAVAFHMLRPHIAASYRFEQLPDALRELEGGRHMGKIVLTFD